MLDQWVVAADEVEAFQLRVAFVPLIVAEVVVVVAEVANAAHALELGVAFEHGADIGVGQVGVGDNAVWNAETIRERLSTPSR